MSRAPDKSQEVKYVYDLPYTERKLLCNILDMNNDWERLGGTHMGFKYFELEEFRRAERCGESPTNRLLQVWGQQNHTLTELFLCLWQMEHYQALRAIQSCIPAKYRQLLLADERRITGIFRSKRPTESSKTEPSATEASRNHSTIHPNKDTSMDSSHVDFSNQTPPSHDTPSRRDKPVMSNSLVGATALEGACALDSSYNPSLHSSTHHLHNFNQDIPDPPSYLTSPKVPAAFLSPSQTPPTLHQEKSEAKRMKPEMTVTENQGLTRIGKGKQAAAAVKENSSHPAQSTEPERKINNNEGYSTCEVSCEDNNGVERTMMEKTTRYDPDQDYMDRLREKEAKEAARQAEVGPNHLTNPASLTLTHSGSPAVPRPTPSQHPAASPLPQPAPIRKISNTSCSSSIDGGSGGCSSSVPVIPYKELEEATALWSQHHLLGRGGFGAVFKGTWKNTEVAVKRIEPHGNASHDDTRLHISQSLEELKLLQSYRHDNILQVYGYSTDHEQYPCLVYQFMPNGSVEDRLQGRKIEAFGLSSVSGGSSFGGGRGERPGLTWRQRYRVAWGTARALQFLHTVKEKPLIHGDVKSANILLDQNFEPKLGDFGLAREGKSQSTSIKVSRVHGTKPYLPDDYLRKKKLSVKVDTYSYGIVLFELCTGLRAYDEKRKEGRFLRDLVEDTAEPETLKDCSVGGHDEEDCVKHVATKRPDMKTVFEELEKFGLVLEENARARKISQGESSSVCSSPHLLQVRYDTASLHCASPAPSTQPPSFPHFIHPVSSPSAASTLPPSSPAPTAHSPVSPAHSPAPPAHSPRPALRYTPQMSPTFTQQVVSRPTGQYYHYPTYYLPHPAPRLGPIRVGINHPPHFLQPQVTVSPAGQDPPSYSETISQGPGVGAMGQVGMIGAVGGMTGTGYDAAPSAIPQFSRLNLSDSSSLDSDFGGSESSIVTSTTQNLRTEMRDRPDPPAAPLGPMMPILTELGTKSTPDVNAALPQLSSLAQQPTAATKTLVLK